MATSIVFLAIASTSIRLKGLNPSEENERPVYYLAPPKEYVETKSATPKSAAEIETFAVDFSDLNQEVELTLSQIDVALNPDISAEHFLNLDMTRDFRASAPEFEAFNDFIIFDRSEVDEPPRMRYATQPDVPYQYRGQYVEVIAFYFVNKDGRTEKPSVLHSSSTDGVFAEETKKAITRWRFRPAQKDGKAVSCWVQQTVRFNQGFTSPFTL